MRVAVSQYVPSFKGLEPEANLLEALGPYLALSIKEMDEPAWDEVKHSAMVEIEVVCGALNFRDLNTIYEGMLGLGGKPATIFGSEIAGIVRRVGRDVEGIEAGKRVVTIAQGKCGRCLYCQSEPRGDVCEAQGPGTSNGFMERVIAPAHGVRVFDSGISFQDAAAYSFSACLAYDLIYRKLKPGHSETIIITAANSSLGTYATQFAIAAGAQVIALVRNDILVQKCHRQKIFSAYKFDRMTSIESVSKRIRRDCKNNRIDCVLDLAADVYGNLSMELLDRKGRYIACGLAGYDKAESRLPWRQIIEKEISVQGVNYNAADVFDPCMELLSTKRAETIIDSIYDIEQLEGASQRAWWSGERYGKVLLRFKDESACLETTGSALD